MPENKEVIIIQDYKNYGFSGIHKRKYILINLCPKILKQVKYFFKYAFRISTLKTKIQN